MIKNIKLAFHFEASDFDSFLLMSDDLDGLLRQVLDSTDLGKVIELGNDYEDNGATFFGDVDGSSPEALLEALDGELKYGIITAVFDAELSNLTSPTWLQLSQQIRELRAKSWPGTGLWSAFEVAPVGVSISEFFDDDLGSNKNIDVTSRLAMLRYIEALENASSQNSKVKDFLRYFEPELNRIKADTASNFCHHWMATELALTQVQLSKVYEPSGEFFEEIGFEVDRFEWTRPETLPDLLGIERECSPDVVLWPSPFPANPYREGSDAGWSYQDALDAFQHVCPGATKFGYLKAAVVMQLLAAFEEEYSPSGSIAKLLEDYSDEIEEVSSLINEEFEWDSVTPLIGEKAEFIKSLELPVNLENFWNDWLDAIGQKVEPSTHL